MSEWGTVVEVERRNRIKLSLYAYAYEFKNKSLVSDSEFDSLAREIDLSIKTGNDLLDSFFEKHFQPDTGMWIHRHPELHKLEQVYKRITNE